MIEPSRPEPDFGSRTDFYTFAPESLADVLPAFEILREVGKGSMGIVYEATRRTDGQRVALKVLPPSLSLTERALARFLREGEIMSRVRHPGIVRVFDHGQRDRLHYFVMEFVDGMNLEDRLAVGPLPARQVASIGLQVARALHFAHDRGVVHRDVKPSNLILTEDEHVVVTDFGLARETGTGSMTESGAIVGTPMYMAPEQIEGDRGSMTARVDVYGLGATLYTLATGQPPFQGMTAQQVLRQVLDKDPVRPGTLRRDLPRDLEAVIVTALEKDPARRYATADEMGDDLARFLEGQRVLAKLPSSIARLGRVLRKHPAIAVLVFAVILSTASAIWLRRSSQQGELKAELARADGLVAKAISLHDAQLKPLDPASRQSLLHNAVAVASDVIQRDPTLARAWFVRAQAHHHLREYRSALHDLDEAERAYGDKTPEVLHYRIDALKNLFDDSSRRQLRGDLADLLEIDPSPYNRCIVAFHLLDIARALPAGPRRAELLDSAQAIVRPVEEPNASAAVVRARILELRGEPELALSEIRGAIERYHGNPLVHEEAARMLRRSGLDLESAAQAELARLLDPRLESDLEEEPEAATADDAFPPPPAPDVGEIERFLQDLKQLLRGDDGSAPTGASGREPTDHLPGVSTRGDR